MMRTCQEIFQGDDARQFLMKCHPINRLEGFKLWHEKVMGFQLKDFHANWVKPLIENTFDRVAIAAPTGFGKTELFGISYPLWKMWYNIPSIHHKDAWSGLIVSTSMPQSLKILDRLKDTISNNELLCELRSYDPTVTWSASEIKLKNGTNLACKPNNENVKSYHVDYAFCDEIASFEDKDCFKQYVSTRIASKKGQLAGVSTPESEEDLLIELQHKPDYHSITTSALDEKGESIWPERYPTEFLNARRRELGERAFALQYLCDVSLPVDDLSYPFPLSLLIKNSDPNMPFEYEPDPKAEYFIAYDPAFSIEGDYNVIVLGKRKDGKIYISQIHRYKGDPDEAVSIIRGLNDKFHPQSIAVDTNAGGSKVLRDMSKFDLPVVSFPFSAPARLESFREVIRSFHAGKIILPTDEKDSRTQGMMKVFFNEMTHIATDKTAAKGLITYKSHTKHDDTAMAFVMLIKNMTKSEDFISYIRSDRGGGGASERELRRFGDKREVNVDTSDTRRFKIGTD